MTLQVRFRVLDVCTCVFSKYWWGSFFFVGAMKRMYIIVVYIEAPCLPKLRRRLDYTKALVSELQEQPKGLLDIAEVLLQC